MGYACPVCEDPQVDAGHLANHVAFTALTGGADHEAWLDDHVPEWGQLGERELAAELVAYADEAEYPQIFEDTTDQGHDHGDEERLPPGTDRGRGSESLSERDREIMADARELTREMLDDESSEGETE